jgi:hypothetical protein
MKLRAKRWLFLTHRWVGVLMCGLFALWFATGIIMMYVEYPELTEEERLAALPALAAAGVVIPVEQAAAASGLGSRFGGIALTTVGERPAYRLRGERGELAVVFADDGSRMGVVTPAAALAAARRSAFVAPDVELAYDGQRDFDQWTVSNVLDEHRPLHRVLVDDANGTALYVSSATAQIVRDTNRRERFWNWLGSTLHWIYPHQLRRHDALWANLLIYLSLAGCICVVTGGVIGWLRVRLRRRYRGAEASPYSGVAKWHHVLGLFGLVFLSTYIFSGLMSMAPWGLFDSRFAEAEQVERFTGGKLALGTLPVLPHGEAALRTAQVKELEWRQVAGAGYVVASRSADERVVMLDDADGVPAAEELQSRIVAAAPALLPQAELVERTLLSEPDDYYYSRHDRYRPLPAYRVKFADPEATWFYIDARTGVVTLKVTAAMRVLRWLYNGLHSLDFAFLLRRGVLWDAIVIALCVAGSAFAATAVFVAWRRLRRSAAHAPR